MNLSEWFQKGMTAEAYIESMKVNKAEMMEIYKDFELERTEQSQSEKLKDKKLRVLVLTEDWCGDAMLNNAILMKLADFADLDLRFLPRDQNLELMDQYLTNGTSRAIPIFIFIDEKGNEVAVWGPRASKVQVLVEEGRASLPEKTAPDFEKKQKEMYGKLINAFRSDQAIWHEVAKSILASIH